MALAVTVLYDALALPRNRHNNRNHWQLVSSVASSQRAMPTVNMRRMCTLRNFAERRCGAMRPQLRHLSQFGGGRMYLLASYDS